MLRNQVIRTARQASHRPAGARPVVLRNSGQVTRNYATAGQQQEAKNASSHIAAGVGGGAVVLLGLYGYYHVSGAKKRMDQLHQVSETFTNVKDKAVQATPSPKAALNFLRSVANSYAAVIPGGSYVVDQTFQQLDAVAEKHGPELSKIVNQAYSKIQKAMAEGGDNATDQIISAVQAAMGEISKLSDQFTSNILKPYLDKSPQLKQALGDSLDQLNDFSGKYGPEAQKLAKDTINDIQKLANEGLNGETIAKAASLAKQRLEQIKELGAKAGSDAYSKAAESAKPYLDKAPDLKKYFEENLDKLKDYVGDDGVKLINDTYAELEEAGKKGDTSALASIVKDRVGKLQKLAKEKGADSLGAGGAGAALTGGAHKLFEQFPDLGNLQELQKLAKEKGGDFEKLLGETVDEVKKILEEKGKKAKDLAGETTEDAKKKATK